MEYVLCKITCFKIEGTLYVYKTKCSFAIHLLAFLTFINGLFKRNKIITLMGTRCGLGVMNCYIEECLVLKMRNYTYSVVMYIC